MIKCLVLLFAMLIVAPISYATQWVFRNNGGDIECAGFLSTGGQPWGNGLLFMGGHAFRLTGYGYWFHGWFTLHDGWQTCLMIDPAEPRIVGVIVWKDIEGMIEVFSTDMQIGEVPITAIAGNE